MVNYYKDIILQINNIILNKNVISIIIKYLDFLYERNNFYNQFRILNMKYFRTEYHRNDFIIIQYPILYSLSKINHPFVKLDVWYCSICGNLKHRILSNINTCKLFSANRNTLCVSFNNSH